MPNEYYLAVGRFVPENNFQTMLTEFMSSTTRRDFVLITDVKQNQFYEILKEKTGFDQDPQVKFVGTVLRSKSAEIYSRACLRLYTRS